jgi:hypothetical protein
MVHMSQDHKERKWTGLVSNTDPAYIFEGEDSHNMSRMIMMMMMVAVVLVCQKVDTKQSYAQD